MIQKWIDKELFLHHSDMWRYRFYQSDDGVMCIEYQEYDKTSKTWKRHGGPESCLTVSEATDFNLFAAAFAEMAQFITDEHEGIMTALRTNSDTVQPKKSSQPS